MIFFSCWPRSAKNGLHIGDDWYHIDLTWEQFPAGSIVKEFAVIKREDLTDSVATVLRCDLLLKRVEDYLNARTGVIS